MFNTLLALAVFLILFFLLLYSVSLGRHFAKWQMRLHGVDKLEALNVAEGALFGLLGLLIAFTFTGAYDRLELRKEKILQEANFIDTAYMRLDMLSPTSQVEVRKDFRDYVDLRAVTYKDVSNFDKLMKLWDNTTQSKLKLWSAALEACKTTNDPVATQLLLPALNDMFDIASERIDGLKMHAPAMVFILLIGLAMLSAFLAGYSTAKKEISHSLYVIAYVAITAFTLYVIINMEFPRVGLIRLDTFDNVLVQVKNQEQ